MKKIIPFLLSGILILSFECLVAQPDKVALDLSTTGKGVLFPRLTTVERNAMNLLAVHDGLLVYDKDLNDFYHWDGTSLLWKMVDSPWGITPDGIFYPSAVSVGTNLSFPGIDLLVRQNANIGEEGSVFIGEANSGDSLFTSSMFFSQVEKFNGFPIYSNNVIIKSNGNTPDEFGPDDPHPEIEMRNPDQSEAIKLDFDNENPEIRINEFNGNPAIQLSSLDAVVSGPSIKLFNGGDSYNTVNLNGDTWGGGYFQLNDYQSNPRMVLSACTFPNFNALINLFDNSGNLSVAIDGDYLGTGDGRVITQELEITGGSDLSEYFDIANTESNENLTGMLVSIDVNNQGKLKITDESYDKKIVGVIPGANGIESGMIMGQQNSIAYGDHPVSLVGRVYVKASNQNGRIIPGDLLTSSAKPGIAMKATHRKKSQGAVIGKAMTSLDGKEGLVLVILLQQ